MPRIGVLGIGCKRGTSADTLETAFAAFCTRHGLAVQAVTAAASIDLKQNEPGLLSFVRRTAGRCGFTLPHSCAARPGSSPPPLLYKA